MDDDYGNNGHRFEMRRERDGRMERGPYGGHRDARDDDERGSRDHRDMHDDYGRDRGGRDHRGTREDRAHDEYEPRMLGNSLASVWEVTAQSRHSFEDAIRYGIDRARRSLRHIRGAWVQGQEVLLRGGEIYAYRVQLKITYVLDDR